MAIRRYRFSSYHPVLRQQLHASLPMVAKWNHVVGGNGVLEGRIVLPDDEDQIAAIRLATEELQSAVYVTGPNSSTPLWGGPLVSRKWDGRALNITCIEWRAWPFQIMLPPDTNTDIYYAYDQVDQVVIARTLLAQAVGVNPVAWGGHPITYSSQISGKLRDLHVYGTEFKWVGELIDSLANRDGGFEWTLQPTISNSDNLPRMNFHCYYPQQGAVLPSLIFRATKEGGNCTFEPITESASTLYSRYYAAGAGQPPDMLFAMDQDPNLAQGSTLRFDGSSSYNTVVERSTLASHARRSRKFYAAGMNLVTVRHLMKQIDPDSYGIGDRARLVLRDRWHSIDMSSVRVISKEIDTSGPGRVTTVLDLTDDTLPEVDTGGSV